MKQVHTEKKSANQSFNKSKTGFASETMRKAFNKRTFSEDKTHTGFMKKKPVRRTIQRTVYPKH